MLGAEKHTIPGSTANSEKDLLEDVGKVQHRMTGTFDRHLAGNEYDKYAPA